MQASKVLCWSSAKEPVKTEIATLLRHKYNDDCDYDYGYYYT